MRHEIPQHAGTDVAEQLSLRRPNDLRFQQENAVLVFDREKRPRTVRCHRVAKASMRVQATLEGRAPSRLSIVALTVLVAIYPTGPNRDAHVNDGIASLPN